MTTTTDAPPKTETDDAIYARLCSPVPLSMPKPVRTPPIDAREARKARQAFVKDGGE